MVEAYVDRDTPVLEWLGFPKYLHQEEAATDGFLKRLPTIILQ